MAFDVLFSGSEYGFELHFLAFIFNLIICVFKEATQGLKYNL